MLSYSFVDTITIYFRYPQPSKINLSCKVLKNIFFLWRGRISVVSLLETCPSMLSSIIVSIFNITSKQSLSRWYRKLIWIFFKNFASLKYFWIPRVCKIHFNHWSNIYNFRVSLYKRAILVNLRDVYFFGNKTQNISKNKSLTKNLKMRINHWFILISFVVEILFLWEMFLQWNGKTFMQHSNWEVKNCTV